MVRIHTNGYYVSILIKGMFVKTPTHTSLIERLSIAEMVRVPTNSKVAWLQSHIRCIPRSGNGSLCYGEENELLNLISPYCPPCS